MNALLDFAALPPEINSARMYAGPGAGPLVTAAAAWAALGAEMGSTATSYRAVLATLTSGLWAGPSSTSMAAAAIPYVSWLTATAAQALQTAGQLESAVAAYEAAFAATVPPVAIEVNRALLTSLAATNLLGQNSAAIAATEARYTEMWAQDATAMYSYARASAAATNLAPFGAPPQIADPAGTTRQGAAISKATAAATGSSAQSAMSSVPELLNSLSSGSVGASNWLLALLNSYPIQSFNSLSELTLGYQLLSEGINFNASGVIFTLTPALALGASPLMSALTAPAAAESDGLAMHDEIAEFGIGLTGDAPESAGTGIAPVSAGLGEAASVGRMSVPPSWGESPAVRLAASALPLVSADGLPQLGDTGAAYSGAAAPLGPVVSAVNAPRGDQTRFRSGVRHKVIPALGVEPTMREDPAAPWVQPTPRGGDDDDRMSERDELNQLRKAFAEVTRQRDVLKRTAATIIADATQK